MGGVTSPCAGWFIALTPAAPQALCERLGPPPEGVSALHPDDLHATLAFLGDCGADAADAAWALACASPPFVAQLAVVDCRLLGVPSAPSAFALILAQDASLDAWVRERTGVVLEAARSRSMHTAFIPHVTMARRRSRSSDLQERILAWMGRARGATLRFDRMALFSRAPEGERRYRAHAWQLLQDAPRHAAG